MRGISSTGKDRIKELVEKLFDRISASLLGKIPSLRNKNIIFNSQLPTLASIFIKALGSRRPNPIEEDSLRSLLNSSYGYIEALKHNTTSNVVEQVDGLIKEAHLNNEIVSQEDIQEVVEEQLDKAKVILKTVAGSEATKIRNVGSATDIIRLSSERNISDPNVFFSIFRTKNTCEWCKKNHLLEDGFTPRVFKMSEVRGGYLSTDDKKAGHVSICGLHPNCNCTLSYLSPGYGFKNGKLEYVSQNHDEYDEQKS